MNATKLCLITCVGLAILVGGFFFLNSYIYDEKQGEPETFEPYRATLSGEYSCLESDGVVSEEECVYILVTDVGERYGINFYLMSQIPEEPVEVGDRIRANGVVTPVERLSADFWHQQDIEGIFSVTDSVEKL